jgi:hypothetical protein
VPGIESRTWNNIPASGPPNKQVKMATVISGVPGMTETMKQEQTKEGRQQLCKNLSGRPSVLVSVDVVG